MATAYASPVKHQFDQIMQDQDEADGSYLGSEQSQDAAEGHWRAITQIITDVQPTLLPDEELADLAAAEEVVTNKENQRAVIVDKLQEELRQLTRQYDLAVLAAKRPVTHPSVAEHDTQVRTLESKQYSLGKALNEEQAGMTKKEAELVRAKVEREEVGKGEIGEDEWIDSKALRLRLLADAGFTMIPPGEDAGAAKVLIRNDEKEDVHTIAVEKNRSKVYYANLLWSLASD